MINNEIKYQTYYKNKLPIAVLPEEYGKVTKKKGNLYIITVSKTSSIYLETSLKNKQQINSIEYLKYGQLLFTWIDKIIDNNSFTRYIGQSTYHYTNKELTLVKSTRKTSPNKKLILLSKKTTDLEINLIKIKQDQSREKR